jgi:hypothetical protein
MYTIEIYEMLNQRASQTAIQPNDATQDQLFDTQHKERPDADMNAIATKKPKELMSLRPLISIPKRSLTA